MTIRTAAFVLILTIATSDGLIQSVLSREKRQSTFNPDTFFENFGYLPSSGERNGSHSDADRELAIREFQQMVGLPVSGILDRRTFRKMQSPRCGVKDVFSPTERQGRRANQPAALRNAPTPLPYYTLGLKWPRNSLTWKIVGTSQLSPRITRTQYRRSFINAFNKWQAVTPLSIRETSANNADILINFYRRDHRDGSPFDGRGGTLAHAFFPGTSDISGDTHFDDDEQWTIASSEGTNLEIVAAHEFGHALGLSHSNVPEALMAPYYQGYDPNYGLHDDDIRGIQSLYGGRPATQRPPRTTTRRPPTTRRTSTSSNTGNQNICRLKFDAIFNGHDRNMYAVRGKYIYKFNSNGVGIQRSFTKNVRRVYPRAPKSPNAIVGIPGYNRVYMFKGGKIFRYTGFRLDTGYPKRQYGSRNFFNKIQAAVQWSNRRVYVFKGDKYSIWDERYASPPSGYPKSISSGWGSIPVNVEAAIRYDGFTYFFKGMNYFKFNDRARDKYSGYPKPKAGPWLGCGRYSPK